MVTCARGSSAHAATFAKHLIERYLGLPVTAAAPSIASVYRRRLHLSGQLVLAISQSGNSDDLIEFASQARGAGALTVAVTNDPASPLAAICEFVLPIGAGSERSVAATKTFLATAAVLLRLVGAWTEDAVLLKAASELPDRLGRASRLDWSRGAEVLSKATHLAAIGRGPTLAIAREAALKLKETCNLHTEAFSGAEFLHGPIALVRPNYPVLVFGPTDEAAAGMRQLCRDLDAMGATLVIADAVPIERDWPPCTSSRCSLKPMRFASCKASILWSSRLATGSGSTSTSRSICRRSPVQHELSRFSTQSQPIASSMEALFTSTPRFL